MRLFESESVLDLKRVDLISASFVSSYLSVKYEIDCSPSLITLSTKILFVRKIMSSSKFFANTGKMFNRDDNK